MFISSVLYAPLTFNLKNLEKKKCIKYYYGVPLTKCDRKAVDKDVLLIKWVDKILTLLGLWNKKKKILESCEFELKIKKKKLYKEYCV